MWELTAGTRFTMSTLVLTRLPLLPEIDRSVKTAAVVIAVVVVVIAAMVVVVVAVVTYFT
jgi:hypothetical protein